MIGGRGLKRKREEKALLHADWNGPTLTPHMAREQASVHSDQAELPVRTTGKKGSSDP